MERQRMRDLKTIFNSVEKCSDGEYGCVGNCDGVAKILMIDNYDLMVNNEEKEDPCKICMKLIELKLKEYDKIKDELKEIEKEELKNKTCYTVEELENDGEEDEDEVITAIKEHCDFTLQGEEFVFIESRDEEGCKYFMREYEVLYRRVSDGRYFSADYKEDTSMGYHNTNPDSLYKTDVKEETKIVLIW